MRPHASRVADSCCALDVHVFNIASWDSMKSTPELAVDVICSQCRKRESRLVARARWDATPAHLRPALVL